MSQPRSIATPPLHRKSVLNKRSERPNASGGDNKPKMNAEQYHELIGRHDHIEHEALSKELAKEFTDIINKKYPSSSNNNNNQFEINNIFYPRQPPPIPSESQFATTWPPMNTIQKAAHMLYNSSFSTEKVLKYFKYKQISDAQILQTQNVCKLLIESDCYYRKLYGEYTDKKVKYQQRYTDETRKYALSKASWELEIAMTLTEFHLDHIVDIVYKLAFWAEDYKYNNNNNNNEELEDTNDGNTESLGTESCSNDSSYSTEYIEATETDEIELDIDHNSEEETISAMIAKEKIKNSKLNNLNINDLNAVQGNIKNEKDFTDLFANLFAKVDVGKGEKVAFAENFEIDLEEDKDSNGNNDEKNEFEVKDNKNNEKEMKMDLDQLQKRYSSMDMALIQQQYIQCNNNLDDTVLQLDIILQSMSSLK